jgi:hypothetical protein
MAESPARDPQRAQVYAMEAEEFGWHAYHRARQKDLRFWLRTMCKKFSVPEPLLKFGPCQTASTNGEYIQEDRTIVLSSKAGPCGLLLAHELAHHIDYVLGAPGAAYHNPRFVLTYMELLDAMRLVPEEGFRAAARRHGVKIARRPTCLSDRGSPGKLGSAERPSRQP